MTSASHPTDRQFDSNGPLPSFDQLLASIASPAASLSPSPMPQSRLGSPAIPFATSRKAPESPFDNGLDRLMHRPSSPSRSRDDMPKHHSAAALARPHFRARAATVPSSFHRTTRLHHECDRREPVVITPHRPPHELMTGHTLGLAPIPSHSPHDQHEHHEHHGNRVQEIKAGDGDLHLDDIVSPMILPERARPHFHGRHFSTSALPSLDHLHKMDQHDHANMPHHDHATVSPSRTPTSTTSTTSFRSASFAGSHSPLSTCEPLTPRSIHMSFEDRLESRRHEWKGRAGRERSVTGSSDGGVRIPTLPRIK